MELLAPVRRWLAGLLGMAYLFDLLLVIARRDNVVEALMPLPLLLFVFLALARPLLGVAGGALWLVISALLSLETGNRFAFSLSSGALLLSETVTIGALVTIAVWRCPPVKALGLVALATTGGLAAGAIRLYDSYYYRGDEGSPVLNVLGGGVVVLGGCLVGYVLRAHEDRGTTTKLSQLIRRQWPLAAALVALIMVDLTGTSLLNPIGRDLLYVVPLVFVVATAVCAVLGPTAPVRYAIIAAVLMVGATTALSPLTLLFGTYDRFPVPISIAASHMALVSYLVRYAERRNAAVGVGAIVGVDLLTIASVFGSVAFSPEFLLVCGFLLVVSMATGQYFRSRDRERTQSVQVAVTGAQQAERMALARELHDVVAHHVTGIVVAAQAAQLVSATNPSAAVQALGRIEAAGGEALAAMRTLVGSMRGAAAAGVEGQATMDVAADLRALVANVHGPEIEMSLDLPESMPPEAGRSVLRIVQESLTNVGKHARDATRVVIDIGVVGDELRLRVVDDGSARVTAPGGAGGYGLIGMRERVDLLGGRLSAGPGEVTGWVVDAAFPLRVEREE
ncbi:signal transduction histidine kinase [Actinokineospora baliensis]|uniref:sensor histidine kinase n=1 Tax=Actinokineospora baliensis TaxID=547056 RepID=UPI0019565EBD|nr:histidine kinase [Actinokineospora baliensis]MBM7771153.1 signal transduction histidine kinase [Actinokineospora baliensis]